MGQLAEAHWAAAGCDSRSLGDAPIPRQHISVHSGGSVLRHTHPSHYRKGFFSPKYVAVCIEASDDVYLKAASIAAQHGVPLFVY